jgi:succinylglutamate desuccinylase
MNKTIFAEKETETSYRIISHQKADETGPVIIAISGIHGNENYGVSAIRKVEELLKEGGGISSGEWIGLAANLPALKKGVRYMGEDMNRIWFPSILDKIRRSDENLLKSPERVEIKQLLRIIDPYLNHENREIIFVDLHSFSAPGGLFVITPRSEKNKIMLQGLSAPLIFGIDDALQGTALRYFHDQGHVSIAFEGGTHNSPGTLVNMVAFLLLLSERFGVIDASFISEFDNFKEHIRHESKNLPEKVELAYQHIIEPTDKFVMRPGFENFQKIKKGDWLADDINGKILSPYDGFMLMPLYQEQGSDGFFIVREF